MGSNCSIRRYFGSAKSVRSCCGAMTGRACALNANQTNQGNNQIAFLAASDGLDGLRAVASPGRTRVAITSQGGIAVSRKDGDWTSVSLGFDTFLRGMTFGASLSAKLANHKN